MQTDLRAGIVRLLKPNSSTAGTGFVVSASGLIATCAHVVQSCANPGSGSSRPEKVQIVFHATGATGEARLVPDGWRDIESGDIAILQVEGSLPEGVQSLLLGPSSGTKGHSFDSFGFPAVSSIEGIRAAGEILGETTIERTAVIQLRSQEVTRGFSGSPVWDRKYQRVVGMTVLISRPDPEERLKETAFLIPAEALRSVCPELQLVVPEKKARRLATQVALGLLLIVFIVSLIVTGPAMMEELALPMTGQINIAIADFGGVQGADIAQAIYQEAQSEIYNDLGFSPQAVEFRHIGTIRDGSQAERRARRLHAAILIWGELESQNPTSYAVYFYILDPREGGGEIAAKLSTPSGQSEVVNQRVKIALVFIKGLTNLFAGKPQAAADEFDRAISLANETNEAREDPKGIGSILDTLYFYKGRALADVGGKNQEALEAYHQALDINAQYAWAYIGIGNIYFTEATTGSGNDYDDRLQQALEAYQQALKIYDESSLRTHLPPASAYIVAKAYVNIGGVYRLQAEQSMRNQNLSQAGEEAAQAEQSYQAALAEYEKAGNVPPLYPAQAHYGLGVVYEVRSHIAAALDLANEAQGQMAEASQEYFTCKELAASDSDPRALDLKKLCEQRYLLVSPTPTP